jgi:hypothetical protein
MRTHILRALVVVALSSSSQAALAQRTTEQFIPIGQSPGVSNVLSYIGEIESVDQSASTVTVAGPDGSMTFRLTDSTDVWLDRSGMQQSNGVGSLADLAPGRRVEVKYQDPETREVAEWIKVAIMEGE